MSGWTVLDNSGSLYWNTGESRIGEYTLYVWLEGKPEMIVVGPMSSVPRKIPYLWEFV